MKTSKSIQRGFTMIELIVVIVILGILAATALPKFVDMSGDAKVAALNGVAGALNSAEAINFSACALRSQVVGGPTAPSTAVCVASTNCTGGAALLTGGALPTGYTITSTSLGASGSAGATVTCTISNSDTPAKTATFTGIYAGP